VIDRVSHRTKVTSFPQMRKRKDGDGGTFGGAQCMSEGWKSQDGTWERWPIRERPTPTQCQAKVEITVPGTYLPFFLPSLH
jgi:hypothetical protein